MTAGTGEGTPSFERDIKPLFRESDCDAMEWSFDLWSHEDVTANAEAIRKTLEDGTMPCDSPWPDDQVETFRHWLAAGAPP